MQNLMRLCVGDGRIGDRKIGSDFGPQRHLGGQHRDPGRDRHHRPPGVAVLVMVHRVRLSRRAQGEFEQIRREQPRAGGLPAQHDAAGRLAHTRVALDRDPNVEFFEIDRMQRHASVVHCAQLDDCIQRRRRDPGDVDVR